MKILAIETSFDETAAAIVEDGTKIVTNVIASSKEMHEKYGGVIPEIAARQQLQSIIPVLTEALSGSNLKEMDALAVTTGPGLIGSLLVGVETAKTIAMTTNLPLIPVNHVLAHMYANFIDNTTIQFPAISLVVSGAHTELYLMKSMKDLKWLGGTVDDAAGECFDKTARLLGFGYGGGVAIEKAAVKGDIKLPRPMLDSSFNFSFSGLKTAVLREWKKRDNPRLAPVFAHEIQESITDVLVEKTLAAANEYGAKSILLSGGVAANKRLREKFPREIHAPPPALCTDNAVFIGSYAYFRGNKQDWRSVNAAPDFSVEI
ncbi:tRNA (adenosine(37)-N6)-threonylcarbamoyltransferase complex transferase subunit TsaD [Candidatus Gottesmanbacteria bacterium]|nr:tRNA (adenosine(37)-N6)-threonylcarbamoyltransferase complex transferase subunit TsaD [Candidatus Gottesmanbacteria bacterium]